MEPAFTVAVMSSTMDVPVCLHLTGVVSKSIRSLAMFRCAVIGLAVVAASSVHSDEQPAIKLPAAGTWVKYHMNVTTADGAEKSAVVEVRFLDRVEVENQACRWIEFSISHPSEEKPETVSVLKMLLPESELLSGKYPIRRAVRFYSPSIDANGKMYHREAVTGDRLLLQQALIGPYLEALPPRRQFGKVSKSRLDVDYQRGQLNCTSMLKSTTLGLKGDERPIWRESWDHDCQFWLQDEVPLGFARGKFREYRTEYFFTPPKPPLVIEESQSEWTLIDFGTGAKSAVPDLK